MQRFSRYFMFGLVAIVVAVCGYEMRADIALISFAPVVHSFDLVLLAAACSLLNYGLRILRWQRYLARLGAPLPLGFTSLTYIAGFAFTVSPGKLGEMARARYYSSVGVELPEVGGAFFVERLMDLVAMSALAALALAAFAHYQSAIWTALVLVAIVLALLTSLRWPDIADSLGSWAGNEARLPGEQLPAWRQGIHSLARLGSGLARTLAAARTLLNPAALVYGFCAGLVAWGLEGLGLYVLSLMISPAHLDPGLAIGIYALAVLIGAISFLPGGLGSTEAVMTTLLATQGYSVADALLITILCRIVTLWLAVCMGWSAVLALRNRPVLSTLQWP